MSELKFASLPVYSPSEPSPHYSCQPATDERTLEQTPRQTRQTPRGSYTKQCRQTTVTLFEQEVGTTCPTYGRNAEISGSVYLEHPNMVVQVTLKIEAKLDTTISESGAESISLINSQYVLWRKGESDQPSDLIPFSCVLPSTFTFADKQQALPPSYVDTSTGLGAFFLRSSYNIIVRVTRSRHRNMEFLTKVDHIKIPFNYSPRTRAHRPILPCPAFFSTVKTMPDEWYQAFSVMKTRILSDTTEPIYCHLFVPGSRVYGIADRVPFHVQINGPLDSLQKLLMPQRENSPPSPSWSTRKSDEKCPLHTKPTIKVFFMRQSQIEVRGYKAWRNTSIGKAEIWELPPAICEPSGSGWQLDWEGVLLCQNDVTVGSFSVGNVNIKDYIVLSVEPPTVDNRPSPFLSLQINVPIRLVSDPYLEINDYNLDHALAAV